MDWTSVVIVALLVAVVVTVAWMFRGRIKAAIKGPGGIGMEVEASNPQPPEPSPEGVSVSNVTARDVKTLNAAGGPTSVSDVDARRDVTTTARRPGDASKKA